MTRVLLVGLEPDAVDYSDPSLPPDMNADKTRAGLQVALTQMTERGWETEFCALLPDETAVPTVERRLTEQSYDCVMIGGGIRVPPSKLVLFEAVVNAVHRAASCAAIAFNTHPENSADAVGRWLRSA